MSSNRDLCSWCNPTNDTKKDLKRKGLGYGCICQTYRSLSPEKKKDLEEKTAKSLAYEWTPISLPPGMAPPLLPTDLNDGGLQEAIENDRLDRFFG